MNAITFPTRKLSDLLLLVSAREIKPRAISARLNFAVTHHDDFVFAVRDFLPDRLIRVECISRLIDVSELHGLTHPDGSGVGLLLSGQHTEKCGLPGAVTADDSDDAARRDVETEIIEENFFTVSLPDSVRFKNELP